MPRPGRYYKIQSMSGQYASYWNAFLFYSTTALKNDTVIELKCRKAVSLKRRIPYSQFAPWFIHLRVPSA